MTEDPRQFNSFRKPPFIIGVIFLFLYSTSFWMPGTMWGVNHFVFLPGITSYLFLLAGIILLFAGTKEKWQRLFTIALPNSWLTPLIIALLMGLLFHNFTIKDDFYGDAPRHKEELAKHEQGLEKRVKYVFSLNVFHSKVGERTVLNAAEWFINKRHASIENTFRWIDTISGMLFVFIWVFFILKYFSDNALRWLFVILGTLAPFTQVFFGHIEIYAPYFASATLYFGLLFFFIRRASVNRLILLSLALFLTMKMHFIGTLLLPSYLLAIVYTYKENLRKWYNWRSAFWILIIPGIVGSVFVYFFVFADYNDPRYLDGTVSTSERLFLPLLSPEAPLDRYNLFSFNHLVDYLNNLLHFGGAALLLLVIALIRRRNINWNAPEVLISGVTFIGVMVFFFLVNPLLSMPMDWDLFALPAPILLFFIVALFNNSAFDSKYLISGVLAISVFTVAIIATNHSSISSSKRLVALGEHTFKTYWIRSAATINHGLSMTEEFDFNRMEEVIAELKPFAQPYDDVEYAHLLWKMAKEYRSRNELELALDYHLKARDYQESFPVNTMGLMDAYYRLNRFDEAYVESKRLLESEYPSKLRALSYVVDCGTKVNAVEVVYEYCEQGLALDPNNTYFQSVLMRNTKVTEERPTMNADTNEVILAQTENAFLAGNFKLAADHAKQLVELQFPNQTKALRIAIHCCVEAGLYKNAEEYCEEYLKIDPTDSFISNVLNRLQTKDDVETIRLMFQSPK